ncbi:MAG: hypothetical protein A2V66_01170 [Ignavibacteria bacterium RBG_13_36_8]|nr:MAG: hypothetical protein A2V66_01170 [Ignavibacteria bacterium RBG_13_36_8]
MRKYLSAFVCGFGAGVMQVVPLAKSFTCCIIVPLAVFFALLLERKANNVPLYQKTDTKKGVIIGILTGIYAALFGSIFEILITLITKNNDIIVAFPEIQKFLNSLPLTEDIKNQVITLFNTIIDEIKENGFSLLYSFSIIINNFIVNTIFGLIGGLIGVQIINSRISKSEK